MLKDRLKHGIPLALAVIAAAVWLPVWAVVLVLMAVCAITMWEFYSFLDAANISNFRVVGTLAGVVLIGVTAWSCAGGSSGRSSLEWLVILGFIFLVMLRQFPRKHSDHALATMSGTLFGFFYVAFLFNFFTKMLVGWDGHDGRMMVIYTLLVVKIMDTAAYFTGCAYGKHKLVPHISPAKTWEGCVGGTLASLVASLAFWGLSGGYLGVVSFTLFDAAVLGIALPIVGIIGDLAESLLKRAAAVKDSSALLPGMGGLLDVIDSPLFAGPVMYVYAHFFLESIV